MSSKVLNKGIVIKYEKLVQYFNIYEARITLLKSLSDNFECETRHVLAVMKSSHYHAIQMEQLFLLIIAKLEILRKEAFFILYGVKSFRYHKGDDSPLYVPDSAVSKTLTDVNAYSAISTEFLTIQVSKFAEDDKLIPIKSKQEFEIMNLKFDTAFFQMQDIFNVIKDKEFEIQSWFKSVQGLQEFFNNGKLYKIYLSSNC